MHPLVQSHINTNNYLDLPSFMRMWRPSSWREYRTAQEVLWPEQQLKIVTDKLSDLPSLISAYEIETLRSHVIEAGLGRRFLLQGGDCAERFQDCNEQQISGRLRILLQMGLVIAHASRRPVVRIGRMAGQYAKPRSELTEFTLEGIEVPAFRGDNINSFDADALGRQPDPDRLMMAYHHAGATLNFIRTLMADGFADLKHLDGWQLDGIQKGLSWARYERIAHGLRDALAFLETVAGPTTPLRGDHEFYVSHEALVLPFEESMTRFVPSHGRWYNMGAHMLWIGDRTRQLDGSHVEYCRGIGNPIGVKIGTDSNPYEILELIRQLNPHNEAGKVTLITRFGAQNVSRLLPPLIDAARVADLHVTWSVDPMHGNTERTVDGRKTRQFSKINAELESTFAAHALRGSVLGGVHLELTHEPVTECTGGSEFLTEGDLNKKYETWCDPRLNGTQSLELSFILANLLR